MSAYQQFASSHADVNQIDENAAIKGKAFGEKTHKPRTVLGAISANNVGLQPHGGAKKVKVFGTAAQKARVAKPTTMHTHHEAVGRSLRPRAANNRAVIPPKSTFGVSSSFLTDIGVNSEDTAMEEEHHISLYADEKLPARIEDIDEGDENNTQMCHEYVNEIYTHLRNLEDKYAIDARYMDSQDDVNEKMRAILLDWLVEVHIKFKLLQETLYLTVSVIDRYLALVPVARTRLQLVGVTAMLLASKYEEIYAPEVRDFQYITDNAYTAKDILDMEQHMLLTMNFELSNPLPLHFLRRASKAARADATTHNTAKFLMELSLIDYGMLAFKPSEIAASALCLSRQINEDGEWEPTIEHYARYTEKEIQACTHHLRLLAMKSIDMKQQAVRKKFSSSRIGQITQIVDKWASFQM